MAGTVIPQVVTEDRASGALVVDGSLGFNGEDQTLKRTPGSIGNRQTWTWSGWVKPLQWNQEHSIFSSYASSSDRLHLRISGGQIQFAQNTGSWDFDIRSNAVLRDNGWYHIVAIADFANSTQNDRARLYVNGERQTLATNTLPSNTTTNTVVNAVKAHYIGEANSSTDFYGRMSQVFLIDGEALGPEYFGYTDQLTGVWRPKKFSGELNSPYFDNWEGDTTGTGFNSSTRKENAFDGNPDTQAATGQNGTMSFTPTPAITGISKVRIKARRDAGANVPANFTLNGTTIGDLWTAGNVATVEITSLGGSPISQLTNLTWKGNTNNNEWFGVYQIEVYSNGSYHTVTQGGINTFYLPFDGNSPIGEDKSGQGNDWIGNFGNISLDKATGARPILNTINGGNVARPGVLGSDENATYKTTSASNSGGQYVFEGLGTRPNFSFVRGATYTFDWSASSSHPLRFATQADAANSSGYTNGTSVSGNVTTITVPHNAPDTLYYYCNVHNGMGNSISVTTDETKADPYAWKCVLALPLVGDDDDESKNINCTQSAAKVVTPNGNARPSTLKSNFYGGSSIFDGNGDYLSIPASSDFSFGSGDYTIEWWMYWENRTGYQSVYDCGYTATNSSLIQSNTGTSRFIVYAQGANVAEETTNAPLKKWIHYAFVRNGNNVTLYRDGSISYAGTHSGTTHGSSTSGVRIGSDVNNYEFTGNIQDFRIYKGVAKYTSEFTPASTKPDILPDSPSGVPTKTKLTKITDGSVNFDGSGDYLYVAPSNDWNLGTNAFTLEAYINLVEAGLDQEIFNLGLDGTHSDGADMNFRLRIAQNERLYAACHSGTSVIGQCYDAAGKKCNIGRWYHVAYVRDGNNFATFIDGVRIATATSSASCNWNAAWGVKIGYAHAGSGGAQNFKGKISNARIVNGTALYDPTSSRVEIPTSPLTNVTNTKLLCCQSTDSAGRAAVYPGTAPQYALQVDGSDYNANYDKYNMFDTTTTSSYLAGDLSKVTWTIPGGLAFSSSLRVRAQHTSGGGTMTFNWSGGTYNLAINDTGQADWYNVTSNVTSPITSVTWTTGNGAIGPYVSAWEVDGTELVDRGPYPNGNAIPDTFNPFNTDISTVKGPESGYCELSALRELTAGYNPSFKEGNLLMDGRGEGLGTLSATSGKYYFEVFCEVTNSANQIYIGIMDAGYVHTERTWDSSVVAALRDSGAFYGSYSSGSAVGYGNGDLLSFAYDVDNKKLYIAKNGVYLNSAIPSQGIGWCFDTRTFNGFRPLVSDANTGQKFRVNFGQNPFRYTPPDGFEPLALSTIRSNSIVARPDQYVGVTTYPGSTGAGTIKDENIEFTPDFVLVKDRTGTEPYALYDTVRGAAGNGNFYRLSTNSQNGNNSPTNELTSMIRGGFTANNNGHIFSNSKNYVSWMWKAGGNKNTFNKDDVGYASADGVLLNAGAQNNIKYNSSAMWTSRVSGNGFSGSGADKLFDGNPDTGALPADNSTLTFTPANPLTGTFTFLYERSGSSVFSINGVNQFLPLYSGNPGGTYTFTGTLTNMSWNRVDSANQVQLKQMTLDGKILRDSNLPSVPTVPATACSIGTKQGFSIIQYTGNGNAGTQIGHGLNQKPDMIIVKALQRTSDWCIYTSTMGKDNYLKLGTNGTDGVATGAFWNNTNPDDVAFTLNSSTDVNGNNESYIAYCWHNVPGMQKFGQFKGNGNAAGPYIELGFRPKILWIKRTQGNGYNWNGYDSTRGTVEGVNPANDVIRLNINNAEEPSYNAGNIDILSNGFKIRGTWANINASNQNYIYCAWAEAPIANLYGAQGNAR